MKVALVTDQLLHRAGSERVFEYVSREFPDADLYSFAYSPALTFPYFAERRIRMPLVSGLIKSRKAYLWSFPIATYAMQNLDLRGYDVVLSCSATVAKYVRPVDGVHLCYCYIPTRALWQSGGYFGKGLAGQLVQPVMGYLRGRDREAARRVNAFLTISRASQEHIARDYNRESEILYCPIDTERFQPKGKKKDHFLIVSRLEHWKRNDYAVEAFRQLDYPLRIIGSGPEETKLRALAGPKTEFVGNVSDSQLAEEYSTARAVIFTPMIEGGMTPVEANACGTPTLCLGAGGVTELQIDYRDAPARGAATSVYIREQTPDAVVHAVKEFETLTFDTQALVEHADQYSVPRFSRSIRNFVEKNAR